MLDQKTIDDLRVDYAGDKKLFIDGKWIEATGETPVAVVSPIDGKSLATLGQATSRDVDLAVKSARSSFDDGRWSRMAPAARKKIMHKIADLIEANAAELAVLGVQDNGTEIAMAQKAEPGSAAATFRYYAEAIDKVYGEIAPTADNVLGLIHKEPVGVIGAIVPWNFPLMIGAWKVAPALAMGNSVVLKPAETASLSLLRLAEICSEAGLPDGVFNVVTGIGATTGEALGLHMDVDVLVFTGSGGVGRRLLEYSAQSNMKRCYLELGGKSPNVVFGDADLSQAAKATALGFFRNSGQVCVAPSRLLVEKTVYNEFVDEVISHARTIKTGNPLDLSTDCGAVNSEAQLIKDIGFADQAIKDGATLALGGKQLLNNSGGYYMEPTIFTDVDPDSQLAQEEVFGPVMGVSAFDEEENAIELANKSDFGLAGFVWTKDVSKAHRMIRHMKAGVIHVNCVGGADVTVPLTGHKQSGNGSDKSMHALEKYTDLKTAWMQL